MKKYILSGLILSLLSVTSCVKDLDVTPKDPDLILSDNLLDDPLYIQQALAKIYASFILSGQGGGKDDTDGPDISASDVNFFTTIRALWNLQEITTDEAICSWTDVGIADLNTQTWSPSNQFLTALYQRLSLSITYANDFINQVNKSSISSKDQYIAEARFLRALSYYYLMDLFGNPPFTTEADGVGKFFPVQIKRADLFHYVISELKDIEADLGDPGFSYPQADKGACWMLMARTYLNADVFLGTDAGKSDSVIYYCNKVIESKAYSLAEDYRQNFSADNDYYHNKEMIFAFESDGMNTQGYVGTTFIIESSSDGTYVRAEDYHGLTENTNWNGNRARKDFMNILVDTLTTYSGSPVPSSDTIFAQAPDKRIFLRQKRSLDIPAPSASGNYGIGVYKFTARNHDGSLPANFSTAYACTDFPVFRFADAYLMRAEAYHKKNDDAAAADDINMIRERAYGDNSGNITAAQVTNKFILDERCREFYYEGQRRTDLVRFGQFTDGDYVWQWKGGTFDGTKVSSYRDIFPIPADEKSANPNIGQNFGY
jgi:starch-binding outer membrane protein, SusD/RagB family